MRDRLEAAIEAAIALLNRLDAPAEDPVPDEDEEPWLAAPEEHEQQLPSDRRPTLKFEFRNF